MFTTTLFEKSSVSTEEQESRSGGGVPNAFRNALFWHWVPAMPKALPAAFVTLLYALASAANSGGQLRFKGGDPIRLSAITKATRGDEKEVRRYLDAAIAAGVVMVEGDRGRGKVTVYVILVSPRPDWGAAVASLEASRKKRTGRSAPVWPEQKNGDPDPELFEDENGVPDPELFHDPEPGERGTGPRWSSGYGPTLSSGYGHPNNPCVTKEEPHETAEVVDQPQVDGPSALDKIDPAAEEDTTALPAGFVRCAKCHERMVPRKGTTTHIHAHCAEETLAAARSRRKAAS